MLPSAGFFSAKMTIKKSYDKCLETLFNLRRFGIILGLDVIENILRKLGEPQKKFKTIHVAGTNGKGSIASTLATILLHAGFRVGLYTSPHLVRFNERICINNFPVSDEDLVAAYESVKVVHQGTREPTFFEFSTAMAFYEFGRQNVDWAVIETGMGGRLDATNIIFPELAIITNISLEHKLYLGKSIHEITREKGGIIKKGIPVVTGVTQKHAASVLKSIAESQSAPFFCFKDAFRVRKNSDRTFNYYGIEHVWRNLHTGLTGGHQVNNAALVLAACEILIKNGLNLTLTNITYGLEKNKWPGRLEIVSETPLILLDGAHNFIAARYLARYLSENLSQRNITLIIGILDDKPYKAMLKDLLPLCKTAILTRPKIDRALAPEKLYAVAKEIIADVRIIPDVDKAIAHAFENASPDDVVCIAGSLYVVGEAKEFFAKRPDLLNKSSIEQKKLN